MAEELEEWAPGGHASGEDAGGELGGGDEGDGDVVPCGEVSNLYS